MTANSEFSVENARQYDHRGALRWILSHLWESRLFLLLIVMFSVGAQLMYSQAQILIGEAADAIVKPGAADDLLKLSLFVLAMFLGSGVSDLIRSLSLSVAAERLEASTRKELYISLLGKSQTFHDRQRVGNIMAMATDDVQQMNQMISPGVLFISDIVLGFGIPILVIASINVQLLLVPLCFIVAYYVAVKNDGSAPDQFTVKGGQLSSGAGWTVKYYLGAKPSESMDITAGVMAGNFQTSLMGPGVVTDESTMIRVEVFGDKTVLSKGAADGTFTLTFTSNNDPAAQDTVRITAVPK